MSFCRVGGLFLLALFASAPAGHAADTLADAKRRAATELLREGRAADAVAMLQEVVRADPTQYKDHLQLARAYDKLNRPADAAEAYHRAVDLLAAGKGDDRAARGDRPAAQVAGRADAEGRRRGGRVPQKARRVGARGDGGEGRAGA